MLLTRRTVVALAAAAAFTAGSIGAVQGAGLEVETVTYGGSAWLSHYPVWIGIKKGFFNDRGLTVEWENFSTGSARMASLAVGEIDFGGSGSISALALMASGAETFYVIAAPDSGNRDGRRSQRQEVGTAFCYQFPHSCTRRA